MTQLCPTFRGAVESTKFHPIRNPIARSEPKSYEKMAGFGEMTEAEKKAEAMRLKDAEMLQRRKQKVDAARFAHIEKTNKIHGEAKPQSAPEQADWRSESEEKRKESKKKGWGIFKKKDKNSPTEVLKSSDDPNLTLKDPPPIAAKSVMPEHTPVEIAPNWAGVDQQNQRAHPNLGHSSDACFPRPPTAAELPKHVPDGPVTKPKPINERYENTGYGAKDRNKSSDISSTIAAFQGGFKPLTGKPRPMRKEKVSSSTSETMDNKGNITRTITKTITDANGKKRTETEVIKIPAKK